VVAKAVSPFQYQVRPLPIIIVPGPRTPPTPVDPYIPPSPPPVISFCGTLGLFCSSPDIPVDEPTPAEQRRLYCAALYDAIIRECKADRNIDKRKECYAAASITEGKCLQGK
jgi:hypothetical protein